MASLRSCSRSVRHSLTTVPSSHSQSNIHRYLSTVLKKSQPNEYVSGLTKEKIDADPKIAEFLQSNFGNNQDDMDGYSIPSDVLQEYGWDESTLIPIPENKYGKPSIDKGLGNEIQQSLNIRKLSSFLRPEEEQGTSACDTLRTNFWIPGMLYGSDPTKNIRGTDQSSRILLKTSWAELQRELDRYHRHFESRVYDLTLYDGEEEETSTTIRVLPRDIQRHPVQGKIYCANFLRYHPGRPIKIPIVYINQEESPALKRDGFIIPVNKYVECLIEDGIPIPKTLELECTGLQLKDVVRIDRLIFPDGVKPSKKVNPDTFVIGPVAGGRGGAQSSSEGETGSSTSKKK